MVTAWCFQADPAAAAKSRPTLCDPIDGSPPSSPVPGILQARILEWVAISFSNAWKWKVKVKSLRVRLLATPWTAAYQAPPSTGFSRQEYCSGLSLPSSSGSSYSSNKLAEFESTDLNSNLNWSQRVSRSTKQFPSTCCYLTLSHNSCHSRFCNLYKEH